MIVDLSFAFILGVAVGVTFMLPRKRAPKTKQWYVRTDGTQTSPYWYFVPLRGSGKMWVKFDPSPSSNA
jgi:hypothetical protein